MFDYELCSVIAMIDAPSKCRVDVLTEDVVFLLRLCYKFVLFLSFLVLANLVFVLVQN